MESQDLAANHHRHAQNNGHAEIIEILHSKAILENFSDSDFPERSTKEAQDNLILIDVKRERKHYCGIRSSLLKPGCFMAAWFFCSFMTIVLNKYILTTLDADPGVLGEFQIIMTTIFGFIAMNLPCNILTQNKQKAAGEYDKMRFLRSMLVLGCLR